MGDESYSALRLLPAQPFCIARRKDSKPTSSSSVSYSNMAIPFGRIGYSTVSRTASQAIIKVKAIHLEPDVDRAVRCPSTLCGSMDHRSADARRIWQAPEAHRGRAALDSLLSPANGPVGRVTPSRMFPRTLGEVKTPRRKTHRTFQVLLEKRTCPGCGEAFGRPDSFPSYALRSSDRGKAPRLEKSFPVRGCFLTLSNIPLVS